MTQPPNETWPQQQGQQPYPPHPHEGYGQPPPGYQFPPTQYPPPYPGQHGAPRKRHKGRKVLGVLAAAIVAAIIGGTLASGSGHTVKTAGGIRAALAHGRPHAVTSAPVSARAGSTISLDGNGSGEQVAVTVTKIIDHASSGDAMTSAPAGDQLYAVQFRIRDTGSAAYSDSPSNGAQVTDSAGQSYSASMIDTASGCASFPGSENIAPGASGLGCVTFEVPLKARITEVQFTLNSGFGPQTGTWKIP